MKKMFSFSVIIIILSLLLSSCSNVFATSTPKPTSTFTPVPTGTQTTTPLPPTASLVPEEAFIKGIMLDKSGTNLDSANAQEVIKQYIMPSGANYVMLGPSCWSSNMSDTNIKCSDKPIEGLLPPVTDAELINAIQYLHSMGQRVVLKPQALVETVVVTNQELQERHWSEGQRKAWFDSYIAFITHYAQIAEDQRVDLFVVGNEQHDNTKYEQDWRRVIAAVRDVYHGPITYAPTAFQFEASRIEFWDALDYIGTNGYKFGMVDKKSATVDDMTRHWQPYIQRLEEMSKQYGKQVIVTEIGARSMQDFNTGRTRDFMALPYDGQGQADFYTAFFEALEGKPWLKGILLWLVSTDPLQGGANDTGFSFIAKPAEQVVRQYFGGSVITTPTARPALVEDPDNSILIYGDNLLYGWRAWNEPNATTIPDFYSSNAHQGSYSIRIPLSKYKELQLVYDTPYLRMSKFKWIEFYLMVGKKQPRSLLVWFHYWTPQAYTHSRKALVNNPDYIEGGQYQPGTWQRIRIPLVDLGITDQVINEIDIRACDWPCTSDPSADDVYVDDIRLVAGKLP